MQIKSITARAATGYKLKKEQNLILARLLNKQALGADGAINNLATVQFRSNGAVYAIASQLAK